MKTEVIQNIPKDIEYPFIGRSSDNTIVLFHESRRGIVLRSGDSKYSGGEYRTDWIMEAFTPLPYGEKVALENS